MAKQHKREGSSPTEKLRNFQGHKKVVIFKILIFSLLLVMINIGAQGTR